MHICVFLDPSRVFRWHGWLAEALRAVPGRRVDIRLASEGHPLPGACRLLFDLEQLIYRVRGNALDPAPDGILDSSVAAAESEALVDVLIDLSGTAASRPASRRLLTPAFNGVPDEIGVVTGLVEGQLPLIEVHDSARPGDPWIAHPACGDAEVFLRTLDAVLSCAVSLIGKAVAEPDLAALPPRVEADPRFGAAPNSIGAAALLRAQASFSRKAVRFLDSLATGGKTWSVAWRAPPAGALFADGRAVLSVLPDDGLRYYADPFPFCWHGRTFVFVEELPYATNRGCISVAELDEAGSFGTPRPIIEEPYHLSYPFVFEHNGEIWMIPESGEAEGIYLYRAERFPDLWKRESCLIDGAKIYDATVLADGGRFWMFACERVWHSSSWDILNLYHSPTLQGEWVPHRGNPVMIDAVLGRPGGAIFWNQGYHVRPVQDCSQGYGGAITLCRIDSLTEDGFAQTPIGRIRCEHHGCHTYNHAGIEVIDIFSKRGLRSVTALYSPASGSLGSHPASRRRLSFRAGARSAAEVLDFSNDEGVIPADGETTKLQSSTFQRG